ncbi:MAG: hypothetical protein IJ232_08965 [Lachnospiraceae bacterium]|nr:hypothetical protein [Lachnospiraceae bacterium]
MKCLVADDEELILKDIKRTVLKVLGDDTEIYEASNSDEVINIINDNNIPIVFLDACVIIGLNQRKPYKSRVAGLSPIILDRKIGTLTLPDDYLCSAA